MHEPNPESSPFAPHLDTNHVPSDEERTKINGHLKHPRRVIEGLDNRVANLKLQMDLLKKERKVYQRYVAKHEALLSPARALPEDILRSIFLFCIAEIPAQPFLAKGKDLDGDHVHPTSAPFLLTYVCRRWRETALSMPELWTNPHITYPSKSTEEGYDEEHPTAAKLLELHLSRSSTLPISMTLKGTDETKIEELHAAAKPLRVAFVAGLQRCRRLTLRVRSIFLVRMINFPHPTTPLLEHVDVRFRGEGTVPNPFHDDAGVLCKGPAVQSIGFTGYLPANYIQALPFDRSRLTSLRMADDSRGRTLLAVLAECPQLRHLYFVVKGLDRGTPPTHTPDTVSLPHLASISISKLAVPDNFFDKLELPALEKLSYSGIISERHLMAPVKKYSSTLRHLSVCPYRVSPQDLSNVLRCAKGLEVLELLDDASHSWSIVERKESPDSVLTGGGTLMMLTPGYRATGGDNSKFVDSWDDMDDEEDTSKRESDIVCPNLREITIRVTRGLPCGISDPVIYTFIERRRELGSPTLQNVTIIQERILPQWEFGVVDELRGNGVDIDGMIIHLQYAEREG